MAALRLTDSGASKRSPAWMAEAEYRWQMNEDAMATGKLARGIRVLTADQIKLEKVLAAKL